MFRLSTVTRLIASIGLIIPMVFGSPAHAATQSILTVSPMAQRITLIPGESYEASVKVSNPGVDMAPLKYLALVAPYSINSETYDYDFRTVGTYTQIAEWITISNPSGYVQSGESTYINFTINVPEDAPAGGQSAAILIRNISSEDYQDNQQNGVTVSDVYEIASIVYAYIAGETIDEGEILQNNVPGFVAAAPLRASSIVKNNGNVHADAKFTLEIFPLFSDEEVYTNAENPETAIVIPNSQYSKVSTWKDCPMVGIFRVRQTVEIFDEISIVERIVVVCPFWLLFLVMTGIILIVFYLWSKANNRKKFEKTEA